MKLAIWASSALLLGLMPALPALADRGGDFHGPHMMWDGPWYGMLFGPLMMIIWIAVAAAIVVLVVRWLGGIGRPPAALGPQGKMPLDILKERFARGEIDQEEFEERRRVLES